MSWITWSTYGVIECYGLTKTEEYLSYARSCDYGIRREEKQPKYRKLYGLQNLFSGMRLQLMAV